jgi:hypothetical protein
MGRINKAHGQPSKSERSVMPASLELASTTPSWFLFYIDRVDTIYLNKRVDPIRFVRDVFHAET